MPQFALIKKNAEGEITEIDTVTYNPKYETTATLAIDDPFTLEGNTDMTPKIMGLPFLGFIGYFAAIAVGTALCIRYLWKKYKLK